MNRRPAWTAALATLLLGLVAVLLNVVAGQRAWRVDLTADARYTLAPETRALLAELRAPLEIRAFLPSTAPAPWSDAARALADLLQSVQAEVGEGVLIRVRDPSEALDPEARAALDEEARGYGLRPAEVPSLAGGQRQSATTWFGLALLYEDEQAVVPPTARVADLEFELARALREVLRPETRRPLVLLSQGHGEPDLLQSPLAPRLRASGDLENFKLDGDLLPGRADALVILGPTRPFDERDRYVIDQFLMSGRAVVAFLDYRQRSTVFPDVLVPVDTGLEPLLAGLGVQVETGWSLLDRTRSGSGAAAPGRGRPGDHREPPGVDRDDGPGRDHPATRGLRSLVAPLAAPSRWPARGPGHQVVVLAEAEATAVRRQGLQRFDPMPLRTPPADATQEQGVGSRAFAVAVVGSFPSGFEAPPPREAGGPPDPPIITAGQGEARLLVVTSGRRLLAAGADSQLLLQNAVDWAVTATDLAGLRARQAQDPPLRPVSAEEDLDPGRQRAGAAAPALSLGRAPPTAAPEVPMSRRIRVLGAAALVLAALALLGRPPPAADALGAPAGPGRGAGHRAVPHRGRPGAPGAGGAGLAGGRGAGGSLRGGRPRRGLREPDRDGQGRAGGRRGPGSLWPDGRRPHRHAGGRGLAADVPRGQGGGRQRTFRPPGAGRPRARARANLRRALDRPASAWRDRRVFPGRTGADVAALRLTRGGREDWAADRAGPDAPGGWRTGRRPRTTPSAPWPTRWPLCWPASPCRRRTSPRS
ncbi:MAG: GldG family protein [bacterium]